MDALIEKKKMKFHDPKKVPLPVIDYYDTRDDLGRFKLVQLIAWNKIACKMYILKGHIVEFLFNKRNDLFIIIYI